MHCALEADEFFRNNLNHNTIVRKAANPVIYFSNIESTMTLDTDNLIKKIGDIWSFSQLSLWNCQSRIHWNVIVGNIR